jgi:two-component system, chemotaxis family, chemotaxis protein CheY
MFHKDTKFLIVDDIPNMRRIIKKILVDLGYNAIFEADDGTTAMDVLIQEALTPEPVGVVLCDWMMPQMKGIDLLKSCRNSPEFKTLPFILLTGKSEYNQIIEAALLDVSEYLVKPFSPDALKQKLARAYSKHNTKTKIA